MLKPGLRVRRPRRSGHRRPKPPPRAPAARRGRPGPAGVGPSLLPAVVDSAARAGPARRQDRASHRCRPRQPRVPAQHGLAICAGPLIDAWSASDVPILRRLAVHGIAVDSGLTRHRQADACCSIVAGSSITSSSTRSSSCSRRDCRPQTESIVDRLVAEAARGPAGRRRRGRPRVRDLQCARVDRPPLDGAERGRSARPDPGRAPGLRAPRPSGLRYVVRRGLRGPRRPDGGRGLPRAPAARPRSRSREAGRVQAGAAPVRRVARRGDRRIRPDGGGGQPRGRAHPPRPGQRSGRGPDPRDPQRLVVRRARRRPGPTRCRSDLAARPRPLGRGDRAPHRPLRAGRKGARSGSGSRSSATLLGPSRASFPMRP